MSIMSTRDEKLALLLKDLASAYIAETSNRESLITVTGVDLGDRGARVTFRVSVFPEAAEGPALGFLMRKRGDCKAYLKAHASLKHVPHVEFVLDAQEKARRKIDELLSE